MPPLPVSFQYEHSALKTSSSTSRCRELTDTCGLVELSITSIGQLSVFSIFVLLLTVFEGGFASVSTRLVLYSRLGWLGIWSMDIRLTQPAIPVSPLIWQVRRGCTTTVAPKLIFILSVAFSSLILWWVRILNQFEVSGKLVLHQ